MAKQRDPKQYAKDIEVVVQDALYNIAESVGDAIADAMGQVNDVSSATLRDIQGGFRDLSKINKIMADASVRASQGEFSRSKASKVILDRKAKERALENAIEIARRNGLENTQELERELAKVKGYNKEIEESLLKQVKASQNINKAQGLSGVALSGLQKLTSKAGLGGLTDVFENAKSASTSLANKLTDGGKKSAGFLGKSRIAAKGMGVALKGVAGYLAGPAGIALLLGKAVKFLLEADKRAALIAQSMNMTKSEAANFNREILRASANTGYLYTRLGEAAELAGQFANNTGIIATNLEVFNADLGVINRRFGLSAEQTSVMAKNMIIAGQSSTQFATQALGAAEALEMQTGVNIQNQAIMKDIADLTTTQFLNLQAQPDLIGRAAAQVRRLGLSFATVESIMGNLLNFEDSISNELEAELILGRQLNLERARSAALNNDYGTVAAEIAKQIGSAAEFQKMNRIEQEALAKAVGMTVDDLSKSLKEQLALEKAGFASAAAREAKYQQYLKDGLTQKEALAKIGMEEFTTMKQNISFQEQLNNLLHNMKIIFMDSINPLLQDATKFLQDNPKVIDKMVTKVKEVVLAVSDFISSLQNADGPLKNIELKFQIFKDLARQITAPFELIGNLFQGAGAFFSGDLTSSAVYTKRLLKNVTDLPGIGALRTGIKYSRGDYDPSTTEGQAYLNRLEEAETQNKILNSILEELQKGSKIYMNGEVVADNITRGAAGSF